jgi:hypothetical protein
MKADVLPVGDQLIFDHERQTFCAAKQGVDGRNKSGHNGYFSHPVNKLSTTPQSSFFFIL